MSEDQAREHLRRFLSADFADATVDLRAAARAGGSPATGTAAQVLGRPPLPFAAVGP